MNPNTLNTFRWLLPLLALFMTAHVRADEDDAFSLVTSLGWQYQDNVFYLPDGSEPTVFGSGTPRGDHNKTASVGLNFDKMIGRQRFTANATETMVRYNRLGILDYDGRSLSAGWQWLLGSDLSGNLRFTNRRYLSGFGDYRTSALSKNLIDSDSLRFEAAYKVDTYWTMFGSAVLDKQRNSAEIRRPNDSDVDRLEAGFRYTTRGGTSFELLGRSIEGDYPRRLPTLNQTNSFTQKDIEARVRWQLVGHSRISAAVGQSRRKHDNVPERDYDDVYGRVSWDWQPTGQTAVTFQAERQIAALDDIVSSYFRTTTYTISPVWQPTGKLRFDGRAQWVSRDGEGDTFFTEAGFVGTPRQEDLNTLSLGATWTIQRNFSANAEIRRDERESNNQFYQYRVRSVSMSLQYVF